MNNKIYTSSRLEAKNDQYVIPSMCLAISPNTKNTSTTTISINDKVQYQSLLGFGGSFTESGAFVLSHGNKKTQKKLIDAYFGKNGLGYTLCRTHIQSCDFSLGNYSYVIDKNDKSLLSFSIARDQVYLIPFIKKALQASAHTINILASPWSPPPFMKTNNSMTYGGKLKSEYAALWAKMFIKYLQAYKKEGIDIWGLTIQNEQEAIQTWDSCLYSAQEEGDFIYNHLVPALHKHKLSPNILAWDHNRDKLYTRMKELYKHPAAKYVWGAGFHWYEEIALGKALHNNVAKTYKEFPDKHLVMTEGCQELMGLQVKMGDWSIGERYARNIIGDLNAGCEGWIDWNMLLDHTGGPNHVGNLCDAPIKYNTETGEIIYANSYYYIGHFSKFIKPGAVRVKHSISNNTNNLKITTWKDGNTLIIVALNTENKAIPYTIRYKGQHISSNIDKHAIQTIIINN